MNLLHCKRYIAQHGRGPHATGAEFAWSVGGLAAFRSGWGFAALWIVVVSLGCGGGAGQPQGPAKTGGLEGAGKLAEGGALSPSSVADTASLLAALIVPTVDKLGVFNARGAVATDAMLLALPTDGSVKGVLLGESKVSQAGLERVVSLPGLTRFDLGDTPIGLEEWKLLLKAEGLENLVLHDSTLIDENLGGLANLANMEVLKLSSPRIMGPGLAVLAKLPKLKTLILVVPEMGTAGVAPIVACKSLESLYLLRSKVSEQELYEIQKALPSLHIH